MRRAKNPGVKCAAIAGLALAAAVDLAGAAVASKSVACSYMQGQELTFPVPKKIGDLPPIEFDVPTRAANTTITKSPTTKVRFAPIRLETQPTTSIATAVTTR